LLLRLFFQAHRFAPRGLRVGVPEILAKFVKDCDTQFADEADVLIDEHDESAED